MDPGSFRNAILKNLDAETIARLRLRKVQLEVRHPLEVPGEPIRDVFFLESGIASVTTRFKDGFEVEAGMHGKYSLTGISAFMGARKSLNASYIQIAGHGFSCNVERAAEEFERGEQHPYFGSRRVGGTSLRVLQHSPRLPSQPDAI